MPGSDSVLFVIPREWIQKISLFILLMYCSILIPIASASTLRVSFETGFTIYDNDANDLDDAIGVIHFNSIVSGWGGVGYYANGTVYEKVENTVYLSFRKTVKDKRIEE